MENAYAYNIHRRSAVQYSSINGNVDGFINEIHINVGTAKQTYITFFDTVPNTIGLFWLWFHSMLQQCQRMQLETENETNHIFFIKLGSFVFFPLYSFSIPIFFLSLLLWMIIFIRCASFDVCTTFHERTKREFNKRRRKRESARD